MDPEEYEGQNKIHQRPRKNRKRALPHRLAGKLAVSRGYLRLMGFGDQHRLRINRKLLALAVHVQADLQIIDHIDEFHFSADDVLSVVQLIQIYLLNFAAADADRDGLSGFRTETDRKFPYQYAGASGKVKMAPFMHRHDDEKHEYRQKYYLHHFQASHPP
ncbi:hypothetical protein BGX30_001081 [Mortierella sp. GBA39]|nr:hypothetical protein BGX30_001081 [Mortierella sp. GBA39]